MIIKVPALLGFLCLPFLVKLFVLALRLEVNSLQIKRSILHKTAALGGCQDPSSLERAICLLTRPNKVCDSCAAAGGGAQK